MLGVARLFTDQAGENQAGTAFFVTDSLALTAFHCVGDRHSGRLTDPRVYLRLGGSRDLHPADVDREMSDAVLDVAALRTASVPSDVDPLRLSDDVGDGDDNRCRAIGFPEGLFPAQPGQTTLVVPRVPGHLVEPKAELDVGAPDGTSAPAIQWVYDGSPMSLLGLSGAPLVVGQGEGERVVGIVRWNPPAANDRELAAGNNVVATPVSALLTVLPELVPLVNRRGSAVLLGSSREPGGDHTRLSVLARPVLADLGFRVTELPLTLDLDDRQALELQSADLVIADMTDHPFGVLEKLIVARRSGVPDLAVTFDPESSRPPILHFPFDIMPLGGTIDESQRNLRQQLAGLHGLVQRFGDRAARDELTSFFRAPLTRVSVAYGLAVGYVTNFVDVVTTALSSVASGGDTASIVMTRPGSDRDTNEHRTLSPTEARDAMFEIVIPEKLQWATDPGILHSCTARGLWRTRVQDENSRIRTLWASVDGDRIRLIDPFPTTMNTMREAIDNLLGADIDSPLAGDGDWRSTPRWQAAEGKEIRRFYSSLIEITERKDRRVRYRQVRVVSWGDVFRADQLPI